MPEQANMEVTTVRKQTTIRRRRVRHGLAVLAFSAGTTVLMPASPAHAAPTCHPQLYTYQGGGWCEYQAGWRYFGGVQCTDGRWYYGPAIDSGNRIGSYGYCPTGSYANRAIVVPF
jgi:hypothetical protein